MNQPKKTPSFVDLSHPITNGAPAFPNDPITSLQPRAVIAKEKFNTTLVSFGSHQGTHLDAMYHFYENGRALDKMPLDWFYGSASLLNIPKGANETIDVEDLTPHENVLLPEAKIIVATGWYERYGAPEYFESSPSFSIEAAQFLADKRIRMLGMDMPTPGKKWLELHHILLSENNEIVLVEGLSNLRQLPATFTFAGFPLNLFGRDGSPIRAVAICD